MNHQYLKQALSDGNHGCCSRMSLPFSSIHKPYNHLYRVTTPAAATLGGSSASGSLSRIASEDGIAAHREIERALDSVVKIFAEISSPNYLLPRQNKPTCHIWGSDWYNTSPRQLCERALRELPRNAGDQLIILSKVLMDDINAGYDGLAELQVRKVNGIEIETLRHLYQLVEHCTSESIRFDLDGERVIVLDYCKAKIATSTIMDRHRVPWGASTDLINEQNSKKNWSWACIISRLCIAQ